MKTITFFLAILFLTMSCSSMKHSSTYKDIHTGAILDDKEIIIADRNVGAKRAGEKGSYLTWKKGMKSCPKGYHLLTMIEFQATVYETKYDNREKLNKGELGMIPAGFIPNDKKGSSIKSESTMGYYHLADNYDDNKNESWYIEYDINDTNADLYYAANYKRKHKDRMQVRCVKN